jgi:hypothetical protein
LIEKFVSGDTVGNLSTGEQKCDGATKSIGQCVDLRCPAAARAADCLAEFPP